ncbi:hypothetical protein ACWDBF_21010 [Streptomyces angustmyceticus]
MNAIVSSITPATSTGPVLPARIVEEGTPLIEMRHLLDPSDTAFAALAVEHPECCSTLADYPEFAAQFGTTKEADCG